MSSPLRLYLLIATKLLKVCVCVVVVVVVAVAVVTVVVGKILSTGISGLIEVGLAK